ncbi:MAG: hypothetical protein J2P24_14870 [Streptosporangiales bacterium]|nr:hypothetical protein [Streptosporangiales bacterium]MBO0891580.1 hypothetical protein [Acidothermales bacterium]
MGTADTDAPSAEDVREYRRQLRTLPADQLVADAVFSLLSAAQAKLGRRDARLLIDLATVSATHARDHLPRDLVRQIDDALGQLRLAQVTAEGRGEPGEVEENDLERMPAPPTTGAADPPAAPTPSSPAAGRLWVPGR